MHISDPPPGRSAWIAGNRSIAQATGWIGLAGVATGALGLALLSGLSRFGEPPERVAASLVADRAAGLASVVFGAATSVLTVVFVAGVRQVLDRSTRAARLVGDVAVSGVVLLFGLVLVGVGLSAAAFVQSGLPGGVAPSTASLLTTVPLVLINLSAVPTLAVVAALSVGFGQESMMPGWLVPATVLVGLVHLGAAVSLAGSGPLAVDGPFAQLAPVSWYVWMAAVAVVLLRRPAVDGS